MSATPPPRSVLWCSSRLHWPRLKYWPSFDGETTKSGPGIASARRRAGCGTCAARRRWACATHMCSSAPTRRAAPAPSNCSVQSVHVPSPPGAHASSAPMPHRDHALRPRAAIAERQRRASGSSWVSARPWDGGPLRQFLARARRRSRPWGFPEANSRSGAAMEIDGELQSLVGGRSGWRRRLALEPSWCLPLAACLWQIPCRIPRRRRHRHHRPPSRTARGGAAPSKARGRAAERRVRGHLRRPRLHLSTSAKNRRPRLRGSPSCARCRSATRGCS